VKWGIRGPWGYHENVILGEKSRGGDVPPKGGGGGGGGKKRRLARGIMTKVQKNTRGELHKRRGPGTRDWSKNKKKK